VLFAGYQVTFRTREAQRDALVASARYQASVTQAVQAGAKGYILKESAAAELIEAISALVAGKSFFNYRGPVTRFLSTIATRMTMKPRTRRRYS
jgi:DNA-binding NarL/FixJ family response regulator